MAGLYNKFQKRQASFMAACQEYIEMLWYYEKKDGAKAIAYSILLLLAITMSIILIPGQLLWRIVATALCLLLLFFTKQKFSSVGLSFVNIWPSLRLGLIWGLVFFFFIIPLAQPYASLDFPHRTLPIMLERVMSLPLGSLVYVVLAALFLSLWEEILFRGYLQTRLHGLIRSNFWAVLVGGIFFAIIHLPTDLTNPAIRSMPFGGWHIFRYSSIVVMHFILNHIYRRHNNLAGAILLHHIISIRNWIFHADVLGV